MLASLVVNSTIILLWMLFYCLSLWSRKRLTKQESAKGIIHALTPGICTLLRSTESGLTKRIWRAMKKAWHGPRARRREVLRTLQATSEKGKRNYLICSFSPIVYHQASRLSRF